MSEQREERLDFYSSLVSALKSSWTSIGVATTVWGYLLQHLKYRTEIHYVIIWWRDLTRGFWTFILPAMNWPNEVKDFLSFTGLAIVASYWAYRRNRYVGTHLHPGLEWLGITALCFYGLLLAAPLFNGIYASGAVEDLGILKTLGWIPIWLLWCLLAPAYFIIRKHHIDTWIPKELRPMSSIWVFPMVGVMTIGFFFAGTPPDRMLQDGAPLVASLLYFLMLWGLARIDGFVAFFQSLVVLAGCLVLDGLIYSISG